MKIATFNNEKKTFDRICTSNRLKLKYDANSDHLNLLQSIFEAREYADYFPFYQDAVILDIGAHVGFFSLFASLNAGPGSRIVAAEPDYGNYAALQKNLFDCRIANVEAMNVAISDVSGDVELYRGKSVNHSLVKEYPLNGERPSHNTVRSISLEDLMRRQNLDRIDFLKMDCEGAEYAIMLKTPDQAFANIKIVSMEFHDMKNALYTGNVLEARLIELGYQIVKFHYEPSTLGLNFGKLIARRN